MFTDVMPVGDAFAVEFVASANPFPQTEAQSLTAFPRD